MVAAAAPTCWPQCVAPVGSGEVDSVTSVVAGFSALPLNWVSNQPQKASTGPSSNTRRLKLAWGRGREGGTGREVGGGEAAGR